MVKASELLEKLQQHIKEYGDEDVLLYDEYVGKYKTIGNGKISRVMRNFVIECEETESDF